MIHGEWGVENGPRLLEMKESFETASATATSHQRIYGGAAELKPALAEQFLRFHLVLVPSQTLWEHSHPL